MIITNLLHEDSESSLLSSHQIAQMQQDCSEYLSNPTMLLRGVTIRHGSPPVANPTIRKDRKSLSSRHVGTAIFNEAFEIEFGYPRVRNECLFITNSVDIAHKYGEMYYVIPTNGSKVASKEGVADSIGIVGNSWHDFTDALKQFMSQEEKNAFARVMMDMNTPNIPDDWFDLALNTLSDSVQDKAQHFMTIIQQKMMDSYVVENVSSIGGSQFPIEYMLFNADQYWMINTEMLSQTVRTPNYKRAWETLIQMIKR